MKAILFDFDGVLANTEPLHFALFQRVLADEGLPLSQHEYYAEYVGFDDKGCFQAVLLRHGRPVSPAIIGGLVARKAALMRESLARTPVVYPGIVDLVTGAAARYRLAIVSGALREEIEWVLNTAGLRKSFEHLTAAEDVRNGKPDPEGYLHALQHLNRTAPIQASECLVIEDTIPGIQAARAAGMRCLAVAHTFPAEQLTLADVVTPTLKGYDLAALESRLGN